MAPSQLDEQDPVHVDALLARMRKEIEHQAGAQRSEQALLDQLRRL